VPVLPAATLPARRTSISESPHRQTGRSRFGAHLKDLVRGRRIRLELPGGTAVGVRRAKAGEKHDQRPSKALAVEQCGKPKKQKKSATPKGCAEVPPKEEVLEDMRRHL